MRPSGYGIGDAAVGVTTGLFGLAAAEVTAAILGNRVGPIDAVAEFVRDLTPGPVVEWAIGLLGTSDKVIVTAAVVVGVVGIAALGGGRRTGPVVFTLLGLFGVIAALTRPAAEDISLVPYLVGTGSWLLCHALLSRRSRALSPEQSAGQEGSRPGTDRRHFLYLLGGVAVASVVGLAGAQWVRARSAVEAARDALNLGASRGVVPDGADLGVSGLGPWQVPNDDFYRIDTAFSVPTVDPDRWQLRIHGMVDREITLSFADLLARERTEAWVTLCCVSNPVGGDLIGNAWWSGVRIAPLLAEAGVSPDADAVLQTSVDGWNCATPIEVLTDDRDALLAVAMNGEPLPIEHGFPVRAVVPGLYGYVSATKWVVDFEVGRFENFTPYWVQRGWAMLGPVKTQSRIDVPRPGTVTAGDLRVAGVAWAQHTGIDKVEVRLDEGDWATCELGRVPSVDTWVQWTTTVDCAPGKHLLTVRATDRTGTTQTEEVVGTVPDGATGWDEVFVTAQ